VKEKEREIIAELKKLGLRVSFRIDNVDAQTKAWEHTVGFFKMPSKEETDKVWKVIRKHYAEWFKHSSQT